MDSAVTGIQPQRAQNLAEAYEYLKRDGAVCISGVGSSANDAMKLGHQMFGDKVLNIPDAAKVLVGGEQDRRDAQHEDHRNPLVPHTDGFAYGDLYPDYILLSCVKDSAIGGESFLVDGYGVLDELGSRDPLFVEKIGSTNVNQTEEGMQNAISPILQKNAAGRKMLRRTFNQRPANNSDDPGSDQAMINTWIKAVEDAGVVAPRFRLRPGEAVIVDNYRALHAREGYIDPDRMMWRVWIWTDESKGVPDMPLHSDSRFATSD
ncbi:MAG: gamma-butyrobetaine dioxygenase [Candidatus Azotimanducaceae bacterium]|jgi:gamma-butyrobetaine dioxygenase